MPGYVIADIEVHDLDTYERYKALVPDSIRPYGVHFLARGGAVEVLEGGWQPKRVVVIEFPSVERAKEWYASAGYQEAARIRQSASTGSLLLVEGP